MQVSTLKAAAIGSWGMALVYDWLERTRGMEVRLLLYAAILTLVISLCTFGRSNKETKKEEA